MPGQTRGIKQGCQVQIGARRAFSTANAHGIAKPALHQDSVAALELRLWVNLLHRTVLSPYG